MQLDTHRFSHIGFAIGLAAQAIIASAATAGAGQLAFAPYVLYDTPGWGDGWAVALGDFDHDGDLDMAAASEYNPIDGRITVYSNNGSGAFESPVYYTSGGTGPTGIVALDLNNDSWIDLAYCLFSPGSSVKVLLNNQAGGFIATQTLYSGNAVWISTGDFNGDGWGDVVSTNSQISGGTARVYLNNGAGSLLAGIEYPVGFMPLGSAVADLDGDNDADIAVASRSTDTVSVLKNNGNGTFAPMQSFAVGETPQFVAAADLNGDQAIDLAISSTGISFTSDVSILLQDSHGGFEPQVTYDVGYDATGIVAVDLDGDADNDLAVVVKPQSRVFVLLNNGTGALAEPVLFACGQPGDTSRAITAADVNADGRLDLAVSNMGINQGIALLINQTPTFVPGDLDGDGVVNTLDLGILLSNWSIPATAPGCGGAPGGPGKDCLADLNGDGFVNSLDLGFLLSSWTL